MTQQQPDLPNWTGLLNWSTKFHDGTSKSQFGPLDTERRRWLEAALSSSYESGESPPKIMAKAIEEISEGRISAGLDLLDYVSDFSDCAEEIDKRGGLEVLISLISSTDVRVVVRALGVLTLYLPNNPRIQLAASLRHDIVGKLKLAIVAHSDEISVIHSAISVMGATIRNVVPLENAFVKEGGCTFIVDIAMQSTDISVVQKVCTIITSLSERNSLADNSERISNLIERIYGSGLFDPKDIQFWEIAASLWRAASFGPYIRSDSIAKRLSWIGEQEEYATERDILRLR